MDEQLQQQQIRKATSTIRLSKHETYQVKGNYDAALFEYHGETNKNQINQDYIESQERLRTLKSDFGTSYKNKRQAENSAFKALSAKLSTDKWNWLFFTGKDSPEMVRVKKTLNLVTNLISQNLSEYVKEDENGAQFVDVPELREKLNTALDECVAACDNYFKKKREQGGGKYSAGIRRLGLVNEVRKRCMEEKLKFGALLESLTVKAGLEENNLEILRERSLQQLTEQHLTLEAEEGSTEWQNEGNSTDVYKIKATNNGENYFIKENIPLISEDISGFLDRRETQLNYSSENRGANVEERRLKDGHVGASDYQLALSFIRALKTRITRADDADRTAVSEKVVSLLAHDFDKMFSELETHNYAADHVDDTDMDWEAASKDKKHPLNGVAVYICSYRKNNMGEAAGGRAGEPLKKMTELEWITKKLGLDANRDRDILNVFRDQSENAIGKLFRVSLGKEVELFGQIRERQGSETKEIAAANNTATYQLAKKMGFEDVITGSETRVVKFKDRNGQMVERFCTVMKEAKGEEFVNLIKRAEKEQMKIHYTPDAVRQLMRLQAFDVVCNQTDRHGRNFKCEFDEDKEKGTIVIKKIMSYDHDNSFGEGSIEKLVAGEKNGFLPGLNKTLKKGSAEYKYVNKKYFGIKCPDWIEKATKPILRGFSNEYGRHRSIKEAPSTMFKNLQPEKSMGQVLMHFKHSDFTSFVTKEGEGDANWYGSIYKRDQMKEDSKYPEGKNEVTDEKEYEEVSQELGTIFTGLKEILDPKRYGTAKENIANGLRTDLKKEEKQEVFRLLDRLHILNEKYDFSTLTPKNTYDRQWCASHSGFLDYWIQNMLYAYANLFREDPDVAELAAGSTEKEYTEEEMEQRRKDMNTLSNENGDLEIPSMLHFDYAAYMQIREIATRDDPQMEADLKLLNFSEAKVKGIKKRCQDILSHLETARKKAEAFFRLAGWKSDTPQGRFFLKAEDGDYDKINDLSQLSVDPGSTYLSIDNENYLFGQQEFSKLAKIEEEDRAFNEEVKKRKDKRWHHEEYGDGKEARKTFLANPLQSAIFKKAG